MRLRWRIRLFSGIISAHGELGLQVNKPFPHKKAQHMKYLAIAAAMVGLVAPVQAEYYPGSTDFEGDSPLADACWSNVVEAAIEADASVADVPWSPNLPPSFDKTSRTNVLSFDTDAPIVRYLLSDRARLAEDGSPHRAGWKCCQCGRQLQNHACTMWQGRLGLAARARAPLPHRVLQLPQEL